MACKPNDIGNFWQELKRRKVFKVVAMYAGTAFIILQLVDIIAQPLQWPVWTLTFVIVLLCIGFIITLLISWIYDITPEGIKKTESIEEVKKKKSQAVPIKRKRRLKASDIIIASMAIVIVILLFPKIFKRDTLEKLRSSGERISVAIMPFQNMTNDTIWNVWQDGIQDILITSLSNSEELKVRQSESITNILLDKGLTNYASITPTVASNISQKLDANVFIYGSIKQVGNTIRVNAQLINSKTEDTFKSFQIDGISDNILHITDSLSNQIKNFLIITKLKEEVSKDYQQYTSTNSPEAYRFFIFGQSAYREEDYTSAIKQLTQAIAIDSNFTFAITMLSLSYRALGLYQEAKKWCLLAYKKRDLMPMQQKMYTNWVYAIIFETPFEELKYLRQLQLIDDQLPHTYFSLGRAYQRLYQHDKAIPQMVKSLEIYKKQGSRPRWALNYTWLGVSYHATGQYKKEKQLYKKAEQDFPDDPGLVYRQAILSLTEGDTVATKSYIDKYISIRRENSASNEAIVSNLADLYSEAGILDKAEEYYRQALSLEPENPARMNKLGWFLIDTDRNIKEGLEINEKALELSPDNHYYLDCKGWGLYKQGKYEEALKIIKKSWELRPIYRHITFLHLEAAKKAVANLKNN